MSEAIIKIENINFSFGEEMLKKQILFDISLAVEPGEIVLMTGPSGSGKTTLLTLIGALRLAQTGNCRVLGRDLRGANEKTLVSVRRHIGYIFQAHNLLASLTAAQNVMMSLELHRELTKKEIKARATEMLRAVGLADKTNSLPENLSGGQKQRVAIARALVATPKLVLADEPTASLDSQSGRNTVEILQRLARECGTSVLLVTHDNRILDIADRVVKIEDGRLTENKTHSQNVPQHKFEVVATT